MERRNRHIGGKGWIVTVETSQRGNHLRIPYRTFLINIVILNPHHLFNWITNIICSLCSFIFLDQIRNNFP